jgi:2-amino-4-hydroxy-6-hydroxymethyldihydropteridine diphosphokinase
MTAGPGVTGAGPGVTGAGPASRTLVLSLGSNLGDRLANLQRGLIELCTPGLACLAVSGVYETRPVGGPEQGDFLNAVLLAASSLPAADILRRCQLAEAALGRVRAERWGPRTLDVDVVAYGDEVSDDPELTLPHPRAHQRAFVLAPWLELAPEAILPGRGPVADLLAAAGADGVRRLPALRLTLPGPAAIDTGSGESGGIEARGIGAGAVEAGAVGAGAVGASAVEAGPVQAGAPCR